MYIEKREGQFKDASFVLSSKMYAVKKKMRRMKVVTLEPIISVSASQLTIFMNVLDSLNP